MISSRLRWASNLGQLAAGVILTESHFSRSSRLRKSGSASWQYATKIDKQWEGLLVLMYHTHVCIKHNGMCCTGRNKGGHL